MLKLIILPTNVAYALQKDVRMFLWRLKYCLIAFWQAIAKLLASTFIVSLIGYLGLALTETLKVPLGTLSTPFQYLYILKASSVHGMNSFILSSLYNLAPCL